MHLLGTLAVTCRYGEMHIQELKLGCEVQKSPHVRTALLKFSCA